MAQASSQSTTASPPGIEFPALSKCVALDLEISPVDSTLMAAAAYRPDTGASLSLSNRPSHGSLQQLDRIADGAQFLLGHNIIKHDLPHLQNYNHDLQLLNQSQGGMCICRVLGIGAGVSRECFGP